MQIILQIKIKKTIKTLQKFLIKFLKIFLMCSYITILSLLVGMEDFLLQITNKVDNNFGSWKDIQKFQKDLKLWQILL